eukprot:scaffold156831_cov35-Prasinocladus_malaysianus.AAC.1
MATFQSELWQHPCLAVILEVEKGNSSTSKYNPKRCGMSQGASIETGIMQCNFQRSSYMLHCCTGLHET